MSPSAAEELESEVRGVLAGWQVRYAGRPAAERRRLQLLALEREQVVAVCYREGALADRLARLPVDPEVRRLLHQCLVWIWQDEQLHATYLRGALLRMPRPLPATVILADQALGAASGWVTGRREDRRRGPGAPLSAGLVLAGRLTGRVSPALARELRRPTFRAYCELNIALERTAELAYDRLIELADEPAERALFERIRDDERRHSDAFRVLAACVDGDDHPTADSEPARLAEALGRQSPWFLPASRRPGARGPGGLGAGAPVVVHRGRPGALAGVVDACVEESGIGALVAARPGRVAVRAAFMLGYDRRDRSNIVDPALIEALAAALRARGATDVAVIEAPTVYGRYFGHRSVAEVAHYFGFTSPSYRIVDAGADQVPFPYLRGLQQQTICRTWHDADVRLVVGKLRTDPTEFGHLCLASLEGMASPIHETIYTDRAVDFRAATMMLLDAAPPDGAIVDAWGPIADGPLGVMGCRTPAVCHRVYAGRDVLDVDRAALADMGLDDARRSPIVRRTYHWFGLEPAPTDVRGEAGPLGGGFRHPWSRRRWRLMTAASYPVYVYMSGHGRAFVPAMDAGAFPPSAPVPVAVRLCRRAVQIGFGLRPGRVAPGAPGGRRG